MELMHALEHRRSIYALSGECPIPDERVEEILSFCLRHTPTAFNSQSPRTVLLLGAQHKKLWEIVLEVLKGITPAERFAATQEKNSSFAAAYGTILFFDETTATEELIQKMPTYKDNFNVWAMQQNGMLMSNVWVALEAEGLGASIQHYNPLIDEQVKTQWQLPASWKLLAQMPFGTPTAPAGAKEFLPMESRYKVFK